MNGKLSLLVLFLTSILTPSLKAQNRCGTMEQLEYLKQQDPGLEARMAAIDRQNENYAGLHSGSKTSTTLITIPVVVHVVYNTAAQNISDNLITSQIDVMNEDYNIYNADLVKVPPFFKGRIGNAQIRFALATQDPNGNPTTGIIRVSTTVTQFPQTGNPVKFTAQGGDDAWPADDYLNIWVCNLGSGLIGYAQFPGGPASTDGVVILYTTFGRISSDPAYNYGRTVTHEVGHWLNLRHIWGDDNGACTGTDQVADTPNCADHNFGGFPCAPITCNNGPTGDMFMNYMDYSDDLYLSMFTAGQISGRVVPTINGSRAALFGSQGLNNTSPASVDAGISEIIYPKGVLCNTTSNTFTPVVTLKNYGTTTLTSCDIIYNISNGANTTFNWTGNLAAGATTNVSLNPVVSVAGSSYRIFFCNTSNPNGTTDGFTINDRMSSSFMGKNNNTTLPLNQSFDAGIFPPLNWANKNYTCDTSWIRTNTASHTGTGCLLFKNYTNNILGKMNDFFTPPLNLTSVSSPSLTFWVAYAPRSASQTDTLEVLISTDCGYTYTSLYKKWGSTLQTDVPQSSLFVPTASQWREETVGLGAYSGVVDAYIIFRNLSGNSNHIYLDDVGVTTTGIKTVDDISYFSIYPNPNNGEFTIAADFKSVEEAKITVTNLLGELVHSKNTGLTNHLSEKLDLRYVADGIYNVAIQTSKGIINRKFNVTH